MSPTFFIVAFDSSLKRVVIKLGNESDNEAKTLISAQNKVTYSLGSKSFILPIDSFTAFKTACIDKEYILSYLPDVESDIEAFLNQADYRVTLDSRHGQIVITPKNDFVDRLYQSGIATWHIGTNRYTVSTSEAYKLPLILPKYNPRVTFDYGDEVKVLLEDEAKKRAELLTISTLEDAPEVKDDIALSLRPFQRVAKKFSHYVGNRAIISYDMGLGKTAIALSVIESLPNVRALIICPNTLKINWKREIKRCTGHDAAMLSGAAPNELAMKSLLNKDIKYHIINYDILGRGDRDKDAKIFISNWAQFINAAGLDFLILDEAHYIKNVDSGRSKAARQLKAKHILHLTGTPVVNRPGELWPLLNMIDPVTFSSKESFEGQWLYSGKTIKNPEGFREMLSKYMIRRRKEDVIKDLPTIERINHFVEMPAAAWDSYNKALMGVYVSLRNPNFEKDINSVLAQLTRCKQIVADACASESASLARDIYEETEKKVLIFSQFVDSCKEITYQLGSEALCITGEDDNETRYTKIDKFQSDPSIKYMVLSTKAGAEGITLTAAHYVIFNDLCWTPKDHRQAEARCYGRLNDMHGATAYYIQVERTITEMIMEILRKKLEIIEESVDGLTASNAQDVSIINEFLFQLKGKLG